MTDTGINNIIIINRQRLFRLNSNEIKLLVRYVLRNEKISDDDGINLMFVRNKVIRKYNKKFLDRDNPTDVISFDGNINEGSVGDIVISVDMAAEYAAENNIEVNDELARYIIHGVLHCLGYEDITVKQKRKMFKRQEDLLREWITRNPCTVIRSR